MPSHSDSPTRRIDGITAREGRGDGSGLDELVPLVYDELRRLARGYLRQERRAVTLQPTALVNEAYLRLQKDRKQEWQSRAQVVGIAARAMRQILIEAARARGAMKRGGGAAQVTLDEGLLAGNARTVDLLAVDDALQRLAHLDSEQAKLVELRFFGGLTIEECAEALSISPATVKRHWTVARAWLQREISRDQADGC
ncbi:MAG: sigma-70 family RNA polymerase sigma factor [Acidobacteria bacterium]|nr:sigma-70 family RNA polymerase sigma factor [Acidobacteriota bacterium]